LEQTFKYFKKLIIKNDKQTFVNSDEIVELLTVLLAIDRKAASEFSTLKFCFCIFNLYCQTDVRVF